MSPFRWSNTGPCWFLALRRLRRAAPCKSTYRAVHECPEANCPRSKLFLFDLAADQLQLLPDVSTSVEVPSTTVGIRRQCVIPPISADSTGSVSVSSPLVSHSFAFVVGSCVLFCRSRRSLPLLLLVSDASVVWSSFCALALQNLLWNYCLALLDHFVDPFTTPSQGILEMTSYRCSE